MGRLQTGLRWGMIGLIAVMPFHAFLSVFLGHNFGNRTLIQSWKEVLVILLGLGVGYLLARKPKLRQRLDQPWVYFVFAYVALSLLVTAATQPPWQAVVFGIKYNLSFLAACLMALVLGDRRLETLSAKVIVTTGAGVGAFATLQAWVLPRDFLARFGYNAQTIEPFRLVDPAVDAVRVLSTLGGPNQLGSFIILPLCLVIYMGLKRFRWWQLPAAGVMLVALFSSYSRSAWIGATASILVLLILWLPRKVRVWVGASTILVGGLSLMLVLQHPAILGSKLQYYLLHTSGSFYQESGSDAERMGAISRGIEAVKAEPLGRGLGTAGPASHASSQEFITENYYLQIASEVGIAGVILFILICLAIAVSLWRRQTHSPLALPLLASLIGVSVINLFLHGWTDSSTALVWWTAAGITLGAENE